MQLCRLSVCALSSMCYGRCMDGQLCCVYGYAACGACVLVRTCELSTKFIQMIFIPYRHRQFKLHAACVLAMYFLQLSDCAEVFFSLAIQQQSLYFCIPHQTCFSHTQFTRYTRKTNEILNANFVLLGVALSSVHRFCLHK